MKAKGQRKGFILIELLTAMAIFAIGITTVFALFVNATKGTIIGLNKTAGWLSSIEAVEAMYSIANNNTSHLTPGKYEVGVNKYSQWVLIPKTGLMGHFLLSNNTLDSSDYENHGTAKNINFAADRKNQRHGSVRFDGTTSYVETKYAFPLQITGALTISAWVSGTENNLMPIAGKYDLNQENGGYLLSKTGSLYKFKIAGPEGYDSISIIGDNLPWEHIVGVYDPGSRSIYLYINGELKAEKITNISYINPVPKIEFFIGTDASKTSFWKGLISDVRIYNNALNSNQIAGLYGSYSSQYSKHLIVEDVSQSLIAHWSLDEEEMCIAHDSSDNHNHGILGPECNTLSPSWVQDRHQKQGKSLMFDGANDFIKISDHSALQIEEEITISAWVKLPDTLPDNDGTIIYKSATGANDYFFTLIYSKNHQGYGWVVSSQILENSNYIQSKNTAVPGEWQHIIATFNGTDRNLYINNNRINDSTISAFSDDQNNSDIYIGQEASGIKKYNGIIDDVRIYNRVISESEIMSLYLGNINYFTSQVI